MTRYQYRVVWRRKDGSEMAMTMGERESLKEIRAPLRDNLASVHRERRPVGEWEPCEEGGDG